MLASFPGVFGGPWKEEKGVECLFRVGRRRVLLRQGSQWRHSRHFELDDSLLCVYWFAGAATSDYQKPCGFDNRSVFSQSSAGRKPNMKVSARPVPPKSCEGESVP